jgi:tetratricopeptide (TPR) repeat protein
MTWLPGTGKRGQLDEAIKLFEEAIAANPELPNPHHGLALTYQRMGQLERAEAALEVLFTKTKAQDARSVPVFANGRALYAEVEKAWRKNGIPMPLRRWKTCGLKLSFYRGIPCAWSRANLRTRPARAFRWHGSMAGIIT